MTTSTPASGFLKFPTFARLSRWCFNWRTLGRAMVGMAALLTLIGLFYGIENWRGRRAWNPYRHALERYGIPVDYSALWPKPVPDDQNFAATPAIKTWFEKPHGADHEQRWSDNYSAAADKLTGAFAESNLRNLHRFTDLAAWARAFTARQSGGSDTNQDYIPPRVDRQSRAAAAPAVLAGLATNEAIFAELRAASRRPLVRYPVNYQVEDTGAILTPHYSDLPQVCSRLQLKACAELAAGRSDRALEDVKLILFLIDSLKTEPLLFSQWTRVYLIPKAVQPIWEGLADHAWSPAQLDELQSRLQRFDFLADCKFGWDAERAGALWTIDCLRSSEEPGWLIRGYDKDMRGMALALFTRWPDRLFRLMPSGWYAREKLNYCQLFNQYFRTGFEPANHRVSPAEIEANAAEANRLYQEYDVKKSLQSVLNHRLAATALIYTNHYGVIRRFCYTQATLDQAALACALEKCRLAGGQFPEKIEALAPQFIAQLPNDTLTGKPYFYRRVDEGRFILYSVGWNEKDDGGIVGSKKDGSLDLRNGDWVWEYPQN